ncbi:MAG: ROK family protein [Planctomycetes bacterium]|nr:ROK family protein [Planctomycetota bacterium]
MTDRVIGIDLGGTNIKAGVVDLEGKVVQSGSIPSEVDKGREAVVKNICHAAEKVMKDAGVKPDRIKGVGLGVPGTLDLEAGVILFSPNLPCLNEAPIRDLVSEQLGVPVVLENDANAAAWGEKWVGAGKGAHSLVMFTLGTGIGGGIIINDEIVHGSNDVAGELGHQTILWNGEKCACGNIGCVERYASCPGMVRRMKAAIARGEPSRLIGDFEAADITRAAQAGDETARRIVEETGRMLGTVATNMMHILNPEMIIFAGGMIAAGGFLLTPILDEVKKRAFEASKKGCRIVFAELGGDAGLIGAAGCALKAAGGK